MPPRLVEPESVSACVSGRPPTRLVLQLPPPLGTGARAAALVVATRPVALVLALPAGVVDPDGQDEAEVEAYSGDVGPATLVQARFPSGRGRGGGAVEDVLLLDIASALVAGHLSRASSANAPEHFFRERGPQELPGAVWPEGPGLAAAFEDWRDALAGEGRLGGYATALEEASAVDTGGETPLAAAVPARRPARVAVPPAAKWAAAAPPP